MDNITQETTVLDSAPVATDQVQDAPVDNSVVGADQSVPPKEEVINTEPWYSTLGTKQGYNQYQQDLNTSYSQQLANRTDLEIKAEQSVKNYFQTEYSNEMQKDLAGWTGGYNLDVDRQMSYLKATIGANMFGQMELQKAGFDTQMAVARLAFEQNQENLALEYYQAATQKALSEAALTGYYLPPEARENLNQQKIAEDILNDPTATEYQKNQARAVSTAVKTWFSSQGITEVGWKTLGRLNYEETVRSNKENERLQEMSINNTIRIAEIQADATIKSTQINADAQLKALQIKLDAANTGNGDGDTDNIPKPDKDKDTGEPKTYTGKGTGNKTKLLRSDMDPYNMSNGKSKENLKKKVYESAQYHTDIQGLLGKR